jgi:hypothetical protein
LSLAAAARVIVAPSTTLAPAAGEVSATAGGGSGTTGTVRVTVVLRPRLSVASAVIVRDVDPTGTK